MIKTREELEEKFKSKWSCDNLLTPKPDRELKNIAKDIYDNKIFTDRHCVDNLLEVFTVLLLMGTTAPFIDPKDDSEIRENELYDILDRDIEQKYYDLYINHIGMIYEHMDKASPMGINGYPMFLSAKFLNKKDAEKVMNYYSKYKEIRDKAEELWN